MLRGTLVLFAGMFTIVILRRQLFIHHWLGMVLITAGAALVGASSVIYASNVHHPDHPDGPHVFPHPRALLGWLGGNAGDDSPIAAAPLFGDILVVMAQMFTALQFILEEKFLVQFKVRE